MLHNIFILFYNIFYIILYYIRLKYIIFFFPNNRESRFLGMRSSWSPHRHAAGRAGRKSPEFPALGAATKKLLTSSARGGGRRGRAGFST